MWLLKSFSKVVVAGPFKSQAEMAKKLGVSQQYVNRKIRKNEFVFHLDGKKVLASREPKFVVSGTNIAVKRKDDLAWHLGVSQDAVEKVLRKKTSGVVQTPKGEVVIQRLKPGEKPILPAVRVLWNDDTEKQDFFSFAAAAKELKIDPKTIPTALKAGKDSFTRKSDGKKFTFEIPGATTRLKPKPLSEERKAKLAEAKRQTMIREEYRKHVYYISPGETIENMESYLEDVAPEALEKIGRKSHPPPESPPKEVSQLPPPQKTIPIPAPRKKVPIPAPRKKNLPPPVPAPRTKVLPAPLPSAEAKVLFENEIGESQREIAKLMRKYDWARGDEQEAQEYQDMLEEVRNLELQLEDYLSMRRKYIGWFLDNEIDEIDETIMVLFLPETGLDVLVKNYDDIANYFQSNEYVDFLSRESFNATLRHGRVEFSAITEDLVQESWKRYIFIKDPEFE